MTEPERAARTAYCYDPIFLEHDLPGHPEGRARLEAVMAELARTGLLDRMHAVRPEPAPFPILSRVHHPDHIARVERTAARGGGFLDPDTYVVENSYRAALLAAGGLVELVAAVVGGRAKNAIGLVRPPGHHATATRGMGFCLFNNIAVAARAALDRHGLQRVLIFDWDVHHGNGTQDIFYDSPEILFVSTHQYPHYPGTGDWREAGNGPGRGYTLNLPLEPGTGDKGFERIVREALFPLAERFRPELILVSAGYDAHWRDPLAGLHLSLTGYWRLSRYVVELSEQLCAGRLVVTLEGGYHLDVLSKGIADTCRALLGDKEPGPDTLGPSEWPEPSLDRLLSGVRRTHGIE